MSFPSKTKESQRKYMENYRLGKRKQRHTRKLSNSEFIAVVEEQFRNLENPSKQTLIYTVMLKTNWNRTQASEAVNLWMVFSHNNLEETNKPKTSEYQEFRKILGGTEDPDTVGLLTRAPDATKEYLREWYAKGNTPEAKNWRKNVQIVKMVFFKFLKTKHNITYDDWQDYFRFSEQKRKELNDAFYAESPDAPVRVDLNHASLSESLREWLKK